MKENIETKDVQRTEYLDKNGLDMLWTKVKENTHNQVEVERNRAVAKENSIIDTKADKSELDNYVSDTALKALEQKVAANTDAISNKQDAGNYLHYKTLNNEGYYEIPDIRIPNSGGNNKIDIDSQSISVNCSYPDSYTTITCDGISNTDNNANHVYATDGSIADLTQYAKKTDIPEIDTSDFVSKTATNVTTGGFGQIRTVDTINNNIGVGDNTSHLAYIGKGELGVIGYRNGYATESFRYSTTYGLETTNTSGYKNVKIPCDSNTVSIYKGNSNNYCTNYRYSGVVLGENNDNNNLLNTNGSYKTIGTDIAPLEKGKVPAEYLDLSQIAAGGNVDDVQVNGVSVVENKIANINSATKESLGVVKVGDGLNVTDGTISVDTTAIGSGKYISYARYEHNDYIMLNDICTERLGIKSRIGSNGLSVCKMTNNGIYSNIQCAKIELQSDKNRIRINDDVIDVYKLDKHAIGGTSDCMFGLSKDGVKLYGGDDNHVLTSNYSTIDITQYVLKSELPTVPTKVSQLQNDSEFITKSVYDEKIAALEARIAALEAKHAETA